MSTPTLYGYTLDREVLSEHNGHPYCMDILPNWIVMLLDIANAVWIHRQQSPEILAFDLVPCGSAHLRI